ncbi:glycosyl hydrolase, glucoamylase [Sphaerochaeta pleomorpha str. Grapes]|uniref:Glycosyl hydrolase, glucoamylase n=1 Tax=Sphaerochaeta pleomorpha (strain ATCC BAA-1885 / DSM 22778 / Grapes) TaxID=158190 RepID=G8QUM3_SPHPG|nr:glycoside hydrolase family 15 protein [Sphaerochaeta pleomorpha]AEV30331.1 glycosyl hydrolase, glucoamylase [Sphaerochaeta pleomorpha str. Grapes]
MKTLVSTNLSLLQQESLDLLLTYQSPSGAFVAGPQFSQYNYCWMRDSSYIAYSLLLYGQQEATHRFINWAMAVLLRNEEKILALPELLEQNPKLDNHRFLGARFTLAGEEDTSDWPNFQPDGYGTLLWLAAKYLEQKQETKLPQAWEKPVSLAIKYIETVWKLPSSDCWEEFHDKQHLSTLACLAGGLQSIFLYLKPSDKQRAIILAQAIRLFIEEQKNPLGFFPKFIGTSLVDASLIWLSTPYGVFNQDDPSMKKTIRLIEEQLLHQGGTQRYAEDTYYGGGLWIPLSGFLGWHYLRSGRVGEARKLLAWMVAQRTEQGSFPEQVTAFTNDPSMIDVWERRWGTIASPLLWSHAMFLILDFEIMQYNEKGEW